MAKTNNLQFDIIIPCAAKDAQLLVSCLKSLRKNMAQARRFIVVSKQPLVENSLVEWFDEIFYPFTAGNLGTAWRYQQALKLYAHSVIPGLLENILVVDSDVVWQKPVEFLDCEGCGLYATSDVLRDIQGYDEFFLKVLRPLGIGRFAGDKSAITHHMLFQKNVLDSLLADAQKVFKKPLWEVISTGKPSEWELYLNYAVSRFPGQVKFRQLKFLVTGDITEALNPNDQSVDYTVCHSHRRKGMIDTHDDGDYHH